MLKEGLVQPTLGQSTLHIWVFVTRIMDEFIQGLDILQAYDVSVDLGTTCRDWAEKKCRCGVPEHDHDHPGLPWPAMR